MSAGGRPYRSISCGPLTRWQRAAWLLRANRLLSGNSRHRTLKGFAKEMASRSTVSIPVSGSTISRWETARLRFPHSVVRGYEEILGLPANLMVSAIDITHRYWARTNSENLALNRKVDVTDPAVHARIDTLLDRAGSNSPMRGADWDELTAVMSAMPHVFLRGGAWDELTTRLLLEQTVSDGVAWHERSEAFQRLLVHPTGQRAAVEACAALGRHHSGQMAIESISILDCSADPLASRVVLGHLENPVSDYAQQGALMACVRKLQYNHFTDEQVNRIAHVLRELWLDRSCSEVRSLAAEVVRSMTTPSRAQTRLRQRLLAARRSQDGSPAPQGLDAGADAVVDRILRRATARLHNDAFHDHVVAIVVGEALFGDSFDTRLYAGTLLAATPYRYPLAAALAAELTSRRIADDPDFAATALTALRLLGGPAERRVVERILHMSTIPPQLLRLAASALGHIGGTTTEPFWIETLRRHGRWYSDQRATATASVLDGLIYSLGMTRNLTLLSAVQRNRNTPSSMRAAAKWWLDLPRTPYRGALLI